MDWIAYHCLVRGATRAMEWEKSMVPARAVGPIRSYAFIGGCFCGRNDIFIFEIGPYIFH